MEIKQLQSFAVVVETLSFTKAAEKLGISQPSISAHIKQLEDELNTKLVVRTTKSIEITAKGRELYECTINMLNMKDNLLRHWEDDSKKIIHLGASTIPAAYIVPELLPKYEEEYPDTEFVIHQGDSKAVADGVISGIYDVGFIGMKVDNELLKCDRFCDDRMVVIAPNTGVFAKIGTSTKVKEAILSNGFIVREPGSGSQKAADRLLTALGISKDDLNITAWVTDQEAIKNLVSAGLGLSIISERAAKNMTESGKLLSFDIPCGDNERSLYVICRKDYLSKSAIASFVKFTEENGAKN